MTLIKEIKTEQARHDAVMQGLLWRALVECNWSLINASEILGMKLWALLQVLQSERYPLLSRVWLKRYL